MSLARINGAQWDEVSNTEIEKINVPFQNGLVGFDRHKLHIYFPENCFDYYTSMPRLKSLLDQATRQKTISGYKSLNISLHITHVDWARPRNIPYALYLLNEITEQNLQDVLLLCRKIEKMFSHLPKLDEKSNSFLLEGDVVLSERLTFRQTAFDTPEYIPAFDPRAKQLAIEARSSRPFKFLHEKLKEKSIEKAGDEKKSEEKSEIITPDILQKIPFEDLPTEKVKAFLENFLDCDDGKALFKDIEGAKNVLMRCLLDAELFIFVSKILNYCPDLNFKSFLITMAIKNSLFYETIDELPSHSSCEIFIKNLQATLNLLNKQKIDFFSVFYSARDFTLKETAEDFFKNTKYKIYFFPAFDPIIEKLNHSSIKDDDDVQKLILQEILYQMENDVQNYLYLAKLIFFKSQVDLLHDLNLKIAKNNLLPA